MASTIAAVFFFNDTATTEIYTLTHERLDAARTAMLGLRPAYDWAPLAARTFDLFERVVLDEP